MTTTPIQVCATRHDTKNGERLPHDNEAEMALLGSLLCRLSIPPEIEEVVRPCDFWEPRHAAIYRVLLQLQHDDGHLDIVLVNTRLRDAGLLEMAGGTEYLIQLTESIPSAAGAPFYAKVVRDKADLRCIADASHTITHSAMEGGDLVSVVEHIENLNKIVSIRAPTGRERARNEKRIPLSKLGDEEHIPWLWYGWLAPGTITLLVALWKAGKTTFVSHVLQACADGDDIAGQIQPFRVLVITEESRQLWRRRRDELDIGDHVHLIIRPFIGRPSTSEWHSFVRKVVRWVHDDEYDAVIFDTWASVSPCPDENDAAAMQAALSPLRLINDAGAAVLLVHHSRKGDGSEGRASRGSGALTGFVDIICELRRYDAANDDDTRRKLKGLSRFDETPHEMVIELRDDGYHTVGTTGDATQEDRLKVIRGVLDAAQEPLTFQQVGGQWPTGGAPKPGKRTIEEDLKKGSSSGRWERTGAGKKGDPYRFVSRTSPSLDAGSEYDHAQQSDDAENLSGADGTGEHFGSQRAPPDPKLDPPRRSATDTGRLAAKPVSIAFRSRTHVTRAWRPAQWPLAWGQPRPKRWPSARSWRGSRSEALTLRKCRLSYFHGDNQRTGATCDQGMRHDAIQAQSGKRRLGGDVKPVHDRRARDDTPDARPPRPLHRRSHQGDAAPATQAKERQVDHGT